VAVTSAKNPPEVDAPVSLECFILGRDHGFAKNGGNVVVGNDHSALEGEGADHASLRVIDFSDGAGTKALQLVDLRKIGGIDDKEAGQRSQHDRCHQHADKEHAADKLSSAQMQRRKLWKQKLHVLGIGTRQNSTILPT